MKNPRRSVPVRFRLMLALASAPLSLFGCGEVLDVDGDHSTADESFRSPLITSAEDVTAAVAGAAGAGESETAVISNGTWEYVAYNARDSSKVTYSNNGTVYTACSGAFENGYSTRNGGAWSRKTLAMPSGYALSWGDPALTMVGTGSTATVFMSTLGMTKNNYNAVPAGQKNASGCLVVNQGENIISRNRMGALLWRGTVGSALTAFSSFADNFSLDGGSMASVGGKMYVAYHNLGDNTATVVNATPTGAATLLPSPSIAGVTGHPVLVTSWVANETGVGMVVPVGNTLKLTTYRPSTNSWTTAVNVATDANMPDVTMKSTGRLIRRGGRSFAVMKDPMTDPKLQIFYERASGAFSQLQGVTCFLSSTPVTCTAQSGWVTPGNTNSFMPAVAYSSKTESTGGHATLFRNYVSYWSDEGRSDGRVRLRFSSLSQGGAMTPTWSGGSTSPCSDLRGYWGDYDAMYTRGNGLDRWSSLIRPVSDSTGATCNRQFFVATPLHVSAVPFAPQ